MNALTVGNVRDAGDGTIGDINGDSSHGLTGDGRMKPTIEATGTDSLGARRHDQRLHRPSGYSMATPHVSGIAATVMEHYPSSGRSRT